MLTFECQVRGLCIFNCKMLYVLGLVLVQTMSYVVDCFVIFAYVCHSLFLLFRQGVLATNFIVLVSFCFVSEDP